MSGILEFSNWLHECVLHDHSDVGTRKAFRLFGQLANVVFCEIVGCSANAQLEHLDTRVRVRQWDVDALLKTAEVWIAGTCNMDSPGSVDGTPDQEPKVCLWRRERGCLQSPCRHLASVNSKDRNSMNNALKEARPSCHVLALAVAHLHKKFGFDASC